MSAARILRYPLLRTAGRLIGPTRVLPPHRLFHASARAFNEPDVEKLQKTVSLLREQIKAAPSLVDKFKMGARYAVQLEQLERLEAKQAPDHPWDPLRLTLTDPLTVPNTQRYKAAYKFLLDRFVSENMLLRQNKQPRPDLLGALMVSFKAEHPTMAALTIKEVEELFHMFTSILNNTDSVDDVFLLDPQVQSMFDNFNWENITTLTDEVRDAAAEAFAIEPEVVTGWFEIRETFLSVPFAQDGVSMQNPLLPADPEVEELQNLMKRAASAGKQNPKKKPGEELFMFQLTSQQLRFFVLGLLGGLLLFAIFSSSDGNREISFQEFTSDFLRKNQVQKIVVVNNRNAYLELNENGQHQHPGAGSFYFSIGSVEAFERNMRAVQDEFNIPDQLRVPVVFTTEGSATKMLVNFLPTLLFLGAIYYMTKKASMGGMGGPLGFGKSTAKKFNQEKDIKIKFKDVAGMNEAKEEVMEFVKFLQNPTKYQKLGAKIPRGAILSGPPGTGKTLIARATAGEAGVPFYSVSGSEFVEMFVGVGASRVRDLFKTARENAPSIVFVDEIDAIGKQRSKGNASGANDERETTLNQLLVEMDGFDSTDHVVVLAGTNRPDILDKALMRPGRFDRHISIDNPELEGRKEIFQVHLKKIKLAENIDKDLPGRLAALTPGFSGADIANVCNEAALIAARYNAKAVTLRHFELAIERVIGGVEKKSKLLDPEEKRIVAYHEAGHAVCGWFLKHAHPLLKVSIIPRGQGALGYAQYLPPDQHLFNVKQLYDRMIMTLGGRVSEELNFASVTSGAHDDFKKVTGIAQSMVMRFGMSDKVGMVNYADSQNQDSLTKPFSDETNEAIDEEVKRIVNECYNSCRELLKEKSKEVEIVATELLKKEFITREDMIRLLGKRPFKETNDAFDKYLDGEAAFKNEKPSDEKKDDEM